MKRALTFSFILVFGFTTSCLQADTNLFNDRDKDKDHYSWRPTDESQYRQAIGMVIWGFSMAAFTILLTALVPNSTSSTTTTGKANTSGKLF